MDNLIYLDEYILAKRVTDDFPGLIQKLNKFNRELSPYRDYIDIAEVMQQINMSIYMINKKKKSGILRA